MSDNILIAGTNRGLGLAQTDNFLSAGRWAQSINRLRTDALSRLERNNPGRHHPFVGDEADESSVQKGRC